MRHAASTLLRKLPFAAAFSAAWLSLGRQALAVSTGLEATAGEAGLSTSTSVEGVVGKVIQQLLGLVGILFLVLIIYAGVTWMTAGGNLEKVGKAKKLIINSIIGIIIIFSARIIVEFVLTEVIQ